MRLAGDLKGSHPGGHVAPSKVGHGPMSWNSSAVVLISVVWLPEMDELYLALCVAAPWNTSTVLRPEGNYASRPS